MNEDLRKKYQLLKEKNNEGIKEWEWRKSLIYIEDKASS